MHTVTKKPKKEVKSIYHFQAEKGRPMPTETSDPTTTISVTTTHLAGK